VEAEFDPKVPIRDASSGNNVGRILVDHYLDAILQHQLAALQPRKLIAKIDSAVRRLYEGEYGYCEVTGDPISLARLEARPIATMTLEAQERHERIEKISRDD
jgi:RNA polymerase-binding transcription factor DksA